MSVSVERNIVQGLPPEYIVAGVFFTIFGIGGYYVLPMALVTSDLNLLMYIFVVLLLMLLFGKLENF
jgi:hypothetical protein